MSVLSLKTTDNEISLSKVGQVQISLFAFLLCHFTLYQLQFGITYGYGQPCRIALQACQTNEVCSISVNATTGICNCLVGFIKFPEDKTCIPHNPDPPPDSRSSSVAIGVSVTIVVLFFVVLISILHYKYRILDGILQHVYRYRRRYSGGEAYEVADDGGDVNPIV